MVALPTGNVDSRTTGPATTAHLGRAAAREDTPAQGGQHPTARVAVVGVTRGRVETAEELRVEMIIQALVAPLSGARAITAFIWDPVVGPEG